MGSSMTHLMQSAVTVSELASFARVARVANAKATLNLRHVSQLVDGQLTLTWDWLSKVAVLN